MRLVLLIVVKLLTIVLCCDVDDCGSIKGSGANVKLVNFVIAPTCKVSFGGVFRSLSVPATLSRRLG